MEQVNPDRVFFCFACITDKKSPPQKVPMEITIHGNVFDGKCPKCGWQCFNQDPFFYDKCHVDKFLANVKDVVISEDIVVQPLIIVENPEEEKIEKCSIDGECGEIHPRTGGR